MGDDRGYVVIHMDEIEPTRSTCGQSRRAFISPDNRVASVHRLDLAAEVRPHYHKKTTEIYYILEGEGTIELNGEDVAVRPGSAVMIKPGTFHRGKGRMRLLVICVPPFEKGDEYFE